ncbi:hypothetical protein D3C85_795710 [compost metagenome]
MQPIPVKQHAVEADRGLDGEAILPGLLEPGLRRRGRGAQHSIGADEVTARGLEPGIQPIRHQRHAQHAGHTQRQRQHEPAQLAAETLAAQQLESQSPLTHDSSLTREAGTASGAGASDASRPAAITNCRWQRWASS